MLEKIVTVVFIETLTIPVFRLVSNLALLYCTVSIQVRSDFMRIYDRRFLDLP